MGVYHAALEIQTRRAGTVEITDAIQRELSRSKLRSGVATVFCTHTSCSLVAMENASPEARAEQLDVEAMLAMSRVVHAALKDPGSGAGG